MGPLLNGKIAKIKFYEEAWVNGKVDFEYPRQ